MITVIIIIVIYYKGQLKDFFAVASGTRSANN